MIVSWNFQYDQIFKFIVCYKNLLFVLKFIKGKFGKVAVIVHKDIVNPEGAQHNYLCYVEIMGSDWLKILLKQ